MGPSLKLDRVIPRIGWYWKLTPKAIPFLPANKFWSTRLVGSIALRSA